MYMLTQHLVTSFPRQQRDDPSSFFASFPATQQVACSIVCLCPNDHALLIPLISEVTNTCHLSRQRFRLFQHLFPRLTPRFSQKSQIMHTSRRNGLRSRIRTGPISFRDPQLPTCISRPALSEFLRIALFFEAFCIPGKPRKVLQMPLCCITTDHLYPRR